MTQRRVLISTLATPLGGVPEMLRFVLSLLEEERYQPVLACYLPYSDAPELSVPCFKLLQRRIGQRTLTTQGRETKALGAWLPELEFTHYWPTRRWRELMRSCRYYLSVSGNCLAATPFAMTGKPFLSWVATPWWEDRQDRAALFPWYRKALDATLNRRITRILERRILTSGTVLALSDYTHRKLDALVRRAVTYDVLRQPVDQQRFRPQPENVIVGRVGFVGRYDDPRKNIPLLLQAVALCRQQGLPLSVELIGAKPDPRLSALAAALGLQDALSFSEPLDHAQLPHRLRRFDVFVLPSFQEGLCISALEAMACACPVVSTRCGGPEEFVVDKQTGFLVEFDAASMAGAITRIVANRPLRARLAENARVWVTRRYDRASARQVFWHAFEHTFN